MFGNNSILKQEFSDGQLLHIVNGSPWLTIQGEGPYAGHAAVFIRLHGCNLRCRFCDTNFDDPHDPVWEISKIVDRVMQIRGAARLVVLTGGEPMRQNIYPLTHRLWGLGFQVQIETAGTIWIQGIEKYADVVVSPKTPSICDEAYNHAVAFKYVIHSHCVRDDTFVPFMATQPRSAPRMLASPRPGAPVYLSPMDEYDEERNESNRRAVAELAIKFNVIAGIQLHKFMGVD